MKRLVNISGGAIKLVGMMACFRRLIMSGVKPNHLTGVSAGAIIGFFYVCGRLEEAFQLAQQSYDRRLIFSRKNDPVGKISGLSASAILKILRGKNYIGEMDNLEKNIRKIISRGDFANFVNSKTAPSFHVAVVSEGTGKTELINIWRCDYDEAISAVIASASIAPTIKARKLFGEFYNDGGHRDSSAGGHMLKTKNLDINECITIWSRPDKETYSKEVIGSTSNFMGRLINFTIGVFLRESSLMDEYVEENECEEQGIKYSPIYLPKFVNSTYDITEEEVIEGVRIGVEAAQNYIDSTDDGRK